MIQRVLLFLSAVALLAFWVLLVAEWGSDALLLALLLAGLPSALEPTYTWWRKRGAQR